MARTHFTTFERDDGTEVTIEYTISDYDAGVSSGPAEICYPPEGGEVEIIKAFTDAGPVIWTDDEDHKWSTKIFEEHDFSDDGWDDYHEREDWA